MKVCSIILARGGSKEIPKKNIINLNGKPLVWYSIMASNESIVNETWLSTDDDEIKSAAEQFGANVIDRPKSISGDFSKSEEALLHFAENVEFDILVFIQPTSPFINSLDINSGLKMLKIYDSIFSAYSQHWLPVWDENISPVGWDTYERPMRQDVGKTYVENGAFYITTKKLLLQNKNRYSGNIGIYEMPFLRSLQIDSYEDLFFIRKLIKSL